MPRQQPIAMFVLGALACALLAAYTSHKLYKMLKIRGVVDGRTTTEHVVVEKTSEQGRRSTVCWFWYDDGGRQKIQADCDVFHQTRVGDRILVVTVNDERYLRSGEIYASDGNFVFDIVLLVAELLGFIALVTIAVIRWRYSHTGK
jgi:hypothetical protein